MSLCFMYTHAHQEFSTQWLTFLFHQRGGGAAFTSTKYMQAIVQPVTFPSAVSWSQCTLLS